MHLLFIRFIRLVQYHLYTAVHSGVIAKGSQRKFRIPAYLEGTLHIILLYDVQ